MQVEESACEAMLGSGADYCQQTSLHGFQYLPRAGWPGRILWSAVILAGAASSVYMSYTNIREYLTVTPEYENRNNNLLSAISIGLDRRYNCPPLRCRLSFRHCLQC